MAQHLENNKIIPDCKFFHEVDFIVITGLAEQEVREFHSNILDTRKNIDG